MRVTEQQLRTLTLAQAIEQTDTEHTLVSPVEREDALRNAVASARARGVERVGVGDVVLERATTLVHHAQGRDETVARLNLPAARLPGLARALPVVALLLGLAIDRLANAHRVDLLSPPLLAVVAWNLIVYALLAWRAWRPRPPDHGAVAGLRHAWSALGRRIGRRRAARLATAFHTRWWARTAPLWSTRAARVLHLCAAAWAAGIALSLLLRGLIVRYQFGWESTFLDASQVHALVSALFWPLTTLLGLEPFSLQDIAATQNFAGEGVAGSRWVWMYVGLLALVVVVPRLALAVWAWTQEARWSRRLAIDPQAPEFDTLRDALPGDFVFGVLGATAAQMEVLRGIGTVHDGHGDRLRFVAASGPAALQSVDAVLICDGEPPAAPSPAWQQAPQQPLPWSACAQSWVLEPALFDQLAAALPHGHQPLARLRQARIDHNEALFSQSVHTLARHLRDGAALITDRDGDGEQYAANYARLAQALDTALWALHGLNMPADGSARTSLPLLPHGGAPTQRRADGTAMVLGTSAGAAAGAAAGAKMGALIDVGTGGLTLGTGTALGALLGGTTAWVVRALHKKDARQDVTRHVTEAALTRYLVIAHHARVPAEDASALADRWRAEVTGTVTAHGAALATALQARATPADPLVPLLHTMLTGILQRSFAPADPAAAPSGHPAPRVV